MSPTFKYVVRNIGTRPFLSVIVIVSTIVVGATLSGVGAVAMGLRQAFAPSGHQNWVFVAKRNTKVEHDSSLPIQDLGKITVAPEVKRFSPESVAATMVVTDGTLQVLALRGLSPQGFAMRGVEVIAGRMPLPRANEVIVGDVLLQRYPWLKIGATVKLINTDFTCVGVFHVSGFVSGELLTTRETYLAHPSWSALSVVYLETDSATDADGLAQRLSQDRALRVSATPEAQFYAGVMQQFNFLVDGMILIFALVVTGATLTAASVLTVFQQARLPELCVMRSIGFRNRAIALLIVGETQLLVLSGGVIGIVAASIALRNYVVSTMGQSLAVVVFAAPLHLSIALAAGIGMFVIGLLGSIVPIVRMMRTPITSGLREQ